MCNDWCSFCGSVFIVAEPQILSITAAYNRAYNALKSLRNDLVAINPDIQFSFRESIEPVYRQYVDLLLQLKDNTNQKPDNLVQAREVIKSLQLAELDNFFRSPCLLPRVDVDKLVEKQKFTAVRAGARSTLATLWAVDDESTSDFMGELYRQLHTGVTKAQAVQRAQLAILAKENRPYFWAPYVLLGNWL